MQPDQLVAELLSRGDMTEETTVDLNRILADWRAGTLDTDDESYLRALHGKVMGLAAEPEAPEAAAKSAPARLDGLTIEDWRDRALRAEAELAQLKGPTA